MRICVSDAASLYRLPGPRAVARTTCCALSLISITLCIESNYLTRARVEFSCRSRMASSSFGDRGPTISSQGANESIHQSNSSDLRKKPQSRQLLSCIKCRERKVKVRSTEEGEAASDADEICSVIARNHALPVVRGDILGSASSLLVKATVTLRSSSHTS